MSDIQAPYYAQEPRGAATLAPVDSLDRRILHFIILHQLAAPARPKNMTRWS
jgi:hypothetical protein